MFLAYGNADNDPMRSQKYILYKDGKKKRIKCANTRRKQDSNWFPDLRLPFLEFAFNSFPLSFFRYYYYRHLFNFPLHILFLLLLLFFFFVASWVGFICDCDSIGSIQHRWNISARKRNHCNTWFMVWKVEHTAGTYLDFGFSSHWTNDTRFATP